MASFDEQVATARAPEPAPAASPPVWRTPLLWRVLLLVARFLVPLFYRLRVVGGVPPRLRQQSLILASNHIGVFDPIALTAACARLGLSPRILATGGLFRATVVGSVLRRCGHLRVDRGRTSVTEALASAVAAVRAGSVVAGYPEGRITLEPGVWPERGRSGMARLALATGAPVIPVSQWGAHEVMTCNSPAQMVWRLLGSVWRRPLVQVRFGPPVDLSDLSAGDSSSVRVATDRIIAALIAGLTPLRADEPGLPRYADPTRPVTSARAYRPR
ncbi:MAG: lysophospholipid acyltransferase family protein [Micromonosporaceae bacterium]